MTTNDHSPPESTTGRRRGWAWLLVPTLLGALIGGALAARVTPVYRSEALVGVAPQRITAPPSSTAIEIGQAVHLAWQSMASRTRLLRIIEEFDLYKEERLSGADPREIVETMRKNVALSAAQGDDDAVAFRIGFTATDPATAMRVAERLTEVLIREHQRDRETMAEGTYEFLSGRLTDMHSRLAEKGKQLHAARERQQPEAETLAIELDVLQATFTDLSAKTEESRLAATREGREGGAHLVILDPARLPERPLAPDWRAYVGGGAAAGVAVGILLLPLGPTRYRRGPEVSGGVLPR